MVRGRLRPTAGRVRQALFNILGPRVRGAHVLDLFAGTGAVGLEALSRGAAACTFVERDPATRRALTENLRRCGLEGQAVVSRLDVRTWLRRLRDHQRSYDLIFLDPPGAAARLSRDGLVLVEHRAALQLPPVIGRLVFRKTHRYGDTSLSIYAQAA